MGNCITNIFLKDLDQITIAKLSPNFSFSWAEMVFNLDLSPSTQTPTATRTSTKLTNYEVSYKREVNLGNY